MKTKDFMVVAIDSNVTIDIKFYAKGPRYMYMYM